MEVGQITASSTEVRNAPLNAPWKPGQSGNPGGRPRGLASYIREITDEGRALGRFMVEILEVSGRFEGARIPLPIRIEAATWLADRGFGKPSQSIDLRVDVEARILTLAAELGLDPVQAIEEVTRVLEGGKQ